MIEYSCADCKNLIFDKQKYKYIYSNRCNINCENYPFINGAEYCPYFELFKKSELFTTSKSRGGKREGAGRKKLPDNIKKHKVNFWITWKEKELIKEFLNKIRSEI